MRAINCHVGSLPRAINPIAKWTCPPRAGKDAEALPASTRNQGVERPHSHMEGSSMRDRVRDGRLTLHRGPRGASEGSKLVDGVTQAVDHPTEQFSPTRTVSARPLGSTNPRPAAPVADERHADSESPTTRLLPRPSAPRVVCTSTASPIAASTPSTSSLRPTTRRTRRADEAGHLSARRHELATVPWWSRATRATAARRVPTGREPTQDELASSAASERRLWGFLVERKRRLEALSGQAGVTK